MFGPESMGKHITQLIANWVCPSETEYIAAFLACHYGDWWLAMCDGTCLTHRRDRVCQRCRPGRRGRHNRLRPRRRLPCKQALSPETGTYGSFPLARRLQQPKDSGDQDLRAFRRAVENELTDLVALVGHATAHSILTHACCLLEGYAKKCKLPAKTSAMVFGLIWFATGLADSPVHRRRS